MNPELNPADFPLGSLESRAAARAMLKRSNTVNRILIFTGLPLPREMPRIALPDFVTYYLAADDSIVEVISREYERGKFTVFVHQMWKGGNVYRGDRRIESLAELEKLSKLDCKSAETMLYESQR